MIECCPRQAEREAWKAVEEALLNVLESTGDPDALEKADEELGKALDAHDPLYWQRIKGEF